MARKRTQGRKSGGKSGAKRVQWRNQHGGGALTNVLFVPHEGKSGRTPPRQRARQPARTYTTGTMGDKLGHHVQAAAGLRTWTKQARAELRHMEAGVLRDALENAIVAEERRVEHHNRKANQARAQIRQLELAGHFTPEQSRQLRGAVLRGRFLVY